ncbi:MAG: CDP-alcohol phosphatidyltransferase family protein [Candidatus Delongbacteria bacterium]|nr:CDP-alcohol phosphatidyltransferase family protein [Candidatus Delongbacteria bacterium]
MLSLMRKEYERFFLPLGTWCHRIGLSPNMLTAMSILSGIGACYVIYRQMWLTAILLILISVLLDVADGSTARWLNQINPLGEVYDHLSDRYVEFLILLGIALTDRVSGFWLLFTLFGMSMASYIRAKAEAKDPEGNYRYGIAERQEKIFLIILGMALQRFFPVYPWLKICIIINGVLSHLTVFQRLFVVRQREKILKK